MNLADSFPRDALPELYVVHISSVFRATRSMRYRFGVSIAGRAKLYIDDKEVIDLWTDLPEKTSDTPVFNAFSMERFFEMDIEAGREYRLLAVLSNEDVDHRVGAAPAGGFRLGGFEIVDEDETISRAVAAARKVDVPIVLTGIGPDYEYEGRDRDNLELPGRVDELIKRVVEANPNAVCQHPLFDSPSDITFVPLIMYQCIGRHYGGRHSHWNALG